MSGFWNFEWDINIYFYDRGGCLRTAAKPEHEHAYNTTSLSHAWLIKQSMYIQTARHKTHIYNRTFIYLTVTGDTIPSFTPSLQNNILLRRIFYGSRNWRRAVSQLSLCSQHACVLQTCRYIYVWISIYIIKEQNFHFILHA